MEEWIAGNLTATIKYDAEQAYGTGRGDYYLQPMGEDEWDKDYAVSSFWNGRGYLRVTDISEGSAKIQVMESKDKVLRTLNLKEGETSASSYLPGFYCKAALKVKLTGLTVPEDMALLNVDGQSIWVRDGSEFLNGKCRVKKLDVRANNDGEIDIRCSGAGKTIPLRLSAEGARFRVNSKDVKKRILEKVDSNKYLAYIGNYPKNFEQDAEEIVVLLDGKVSSSKSRAVYLAIENMKKLKGKNKGDFESELGKTVKDAIVVAKGELKDDINFIGAEKVLSDKNYNNVVDKYFKLGNLTVSELLDLYRSEEKESGETWGEEVLYEQILLAGQVGKFASQKVLMDVFLDLYPLSKISSHIRDLRRKMKGTDYSESYASFYVGDEFRAISVVDFRVADEGERRVDLRVGNIPYNKLNESSKIHFGDKITLEIKQILPGKVKVYFDSDKNGVRSKPVTIKEDDCIFLTGKRFMLGILR